jgi:hypothetical protein
MIVNWTHPFRGDNIPIAIPYFIQVHDETRLRWNLAEDLQSDAAGDQCRFTGLGLESRLTSAT